MREDIPAARMTVAMVGAELSSAGSGPAGLTAAASQRQGSLAPACSDLDELGGYADSDLLGCLGRDLETDGRVHPG